MSSTLITESRATDSESDTTPEAAPAKPKKRPPANFHGKPGRSGPPRNFNAAKNFGYSRLSLTVLPKSLSTIKRSVNDFRNGLEAAVSAVSSGVSPTQAVLINSAAWHERLTRIWAKRLIDEYEGISHNDLATITDRIAKHAAARDAAIKALDLDAVDRAGWDAIDLPPLPALPHHNGATHAAATSLDSQDQPTTANASGAVQGGFIRQRGTESTTPEEPRDA